VLRCSHIVCKVDDVRVMVRDYERLGFSVTWGSDPARAHNAFVWFNDGPFLEFFELPPAFALLRWPLRLAYGAAAGDRLVRWARRGEGWRDLALETDATDLSETRSALLAGGVRVSRVMKGRRKRPDGQTVRYQFLACHPAMLPFVVSAYDPPQRPARVVHRNGAASVARVRMGVAAADRATFDALVPHDRWLSPEPATRTHVLAVELDGLADELDRDKLHGAVLVPSRKSPPLRAHSAAAEPAASPTASTALRRPHAWLKTS
jgi:Glyoxalase-like domain